MFLAEGLLKVSKPLKLKLLKLFYKLSYDLLPPYLRRYREVIDKDPPRVLRIGISYISLGLNEHMLSVHCTPLYQLIKLITIMKTDPTDTVLCKIAENSQSYVQLSNYIKKSFLNAYDPICRIENCFVCKLQDIWLCCIKYIIMYLYNY